MKIADFRNSVIALAIGLFAVSCGGSGNRQQGTASQSETLQQATEIVNKTLQDAEKGLSLTDGAKAKIASLGKSVKDEKMVYFHQAGASRNYTVETYQNGAVIEELKYSFFYREHEASFKSSLEASERGLEVVEKSEADLWIGIKERPGRMTWQATYDLYKDMTGYVVVE